MVTLLLRYKVGLLSGLGVTLSMCGMAWILGPLLGIVVGGLAYRMPKPVGSLLTGLSFLVASVPAMILFFWVHYPLQDFFEVVIDPYWTSCLILVGINVVKMAQILREALTEFPKQYRLAGKVCGMSGQDILLKIEIPLLLRQMIPQVLLQQVAILQLTLFASLISVPEIFRVCQQINALEYRPIEIFSAIALFFMVICLPLTLLAHGLQARYTRNISER